MSNYLLLPEQVVEDKRLGRHRRLGWKGTARSLPSLRAVGVQSRFWPPTNKRALKQWVGSCVGHAVVQNAACAPFCRVATEAEAMMVYSRATELDPFPGAYPPDDTGSTGFAAMQAAVEMGIFRGYAATDCLTEVIEALQTRPGILGIDWYAQFDDLPADGLASPGTSVIRGGHETVIAGCDHPGKRVLLRNSWGEWGIEHEGANGYFWLGYRDFQLLLVSGGDAIFPDLP